MRKHWTSIALSCSLKWKRAGWVLLAMPVVSVLWYAIRESAKRKSFAEVSISNVFEFVFIVGFIAMAYACVTVSGSSRSEYTRARMLTSERTQYLWEILVCCLFFLMLWQIEVITIYLGGIVHGLFPWNKYHPQDVAKAVQHNEYYLTVIPQTLVGWLMRLAAVLCAGVGCASITMHRKGSLDFVFAMLTLVFVPFLFGRNGLRAGLAEWFAVITLVLSIRRLTDGRGRDTDETMDG